MTTHIFDFYAGPGGGKSTSAAFAYYYLKRKGVNTEMVREYVKEWAWERRNIGPYDQLYFMGKQLRKESLLYGKVQAIVTDSPVLMSAFYAEKYAPKHVARGVKEAVKAFYEQAAADGYRHHHIFLLRNHAYQSEGRYQTEQEALDIDHGILEMLKELAPNHTVSGTQETQLTRLIDNVL